MQREYKNRLVLVFFFSKYLLTDLSFKNASTKVFVRQDKRDSQKDVKAWFKRRTLHVPNLIPIWVDLNN